PAHQSVRVVDKDTEQAHLVIGGPGLARTDERRFALGVLNAALGGGVSSRLFPEIRGERGLAYSVYRCTSQYGATGNFGRPPDRRGHPGRRTCGGRRRPGPAAGPHGHRPVQGTRVHSLIASPRRKAARPPENSVSALTPAAVRAVSAM